MRKTLKGSIIESRLVFGQQTLPAECQLSFRSVRGDLINICGRRYDFDETTRDRLIEVLAPAKGLNRDKAKVHVTPEGNVTRLDVDGESILFKAPLYPDTECDTFALRRCLRDVHRKVEFNRAFLNLSTSETARQAIEPHMLVSLIESYRSDVIEVIALQYRRIFESLFHACWVANRNRVTLPNDTWRLEAFDKAFSEVDPNFFLEPLYFDFRSLRGEKSWGMSKDSIRKAYDECGKHLHTGSPFLSKANKVAFANKTIEWSKSLRQLLSFGRMSIGADRFAYYRLSESKSPVVVWVDDLKPRSVPVEVVASLESWRARHDAGLQSRKQALASR